MLSACADPQYFKPGTSQQQADQAKLECQALYQRLQPANPYPFYDTCMSSKGFYRKQ